MAKNLVNGTNIIVEENGDNINMNLSSDYNTALQNYFECKILWTNPSPTSSFTSQTITLSSGDYDFYEIFFTYSVSTSQYANGTKAVKGKGLIGAIIGYGNSVLLRRKVDYTDATHLLVASAYNGSAIDDNYMIPIYVIGYKTGTF